MRRVLFLDFDGVLNNTGWFTKQAAYWKGVPGALRAPREERDFDPENMKMLGALILMVPGLKIVVSSSWRKGRTLDQLRGYLAGYVPPRRVVDVTGAHESRLRHIEITEWLDAQDPPVDRFVALDDDTFDMTPLGANFIHVHRAAGLTWAHVQAVVAHLMGAR